MQFEQLLSGCDKRVRADWLPFGVEWHAVNESPTEQDRIHFPTGAWRVQIYRWRQIPQSVDQLHRSESCTGQPIDRQFT